MDDMLLLSKQERRAEQAAVVTFNKVSDTALLRDKLQPLGTFLADSAVRTICINRPGEVFNRTRQGWTRYEVASVSRRWCEEFLLLLSAKTPQTCRGDSPFLSAALPSGEQIQVLGTTGAEPGGLSITIDKPSRAGDQLTDFTEGGMADEKTMAQRLRKLNGDREFWAFYAAAIAARKNIVIADPTGSGKATFRRTFTNFLIPGHERILTIGTSPASLLPGHLNQVHAYSEKGWTALPAFVRACRRMKPDRVLLEEIAPAIAHAYVLGIASRYRGCITTVQASSCEEALQRMADVIRKSGTGRSISQLDAMRMLQSAFDIVVQLRATEGIEENFRHIDDVTYLTR